LPIHLLQILCLDICVFLLQFSKSLPLLVFYKLDLLIVKRVQFPLFVIFLSNFSELRLRALQLSIETLTAKQLISLRLNLQILVLHNIFYEEFAIANFTYFTFYIRTVFFYSCIPPEFLLVFFNRDVSLVIRIRPLLVPTFGTILQSTKVTWLDIFGILKPFTAASTNFLIFLIGIR
jgi:uncharacterized protein YjbI with pentapeptide repeats